MDGLRQSVRSYFRMDERGARIGAEARGAVATFLTMSYILFANPGILQAAGVPFASAVACTAAAAGVCCLLMGLLANAPIALASGMGLNAIIAYTVAPAAGSWQTAMGLVVLNGVIILILVVVGLREAVMDAIPKDLRLAIGGGIGLFIALIGAVNARMVVVPGGTLAVLSNDPAAAMPPVASGSLLAPDTAVAVIGLLVAAVLLALRTKGAFVLAILIATAIGVPFGVTDLAPLKNMTWPSFEVAFQADVRDAMKVSLLPLLFAFLMVDFFDTLGTATAVSEQAGLVDKNGKIPGIRNILMVDSISAAIGGLMGVSSVTSYIESAAGVSEGARTGLHTVIVGLLFLLAIFLAPVAAVVPACATAPALILIGFLMFAQMARIRFDQYDTAIPAFITLVTLPFTYSISHGIGYGFVSYVVIKICSRRFHDVHPLMYVVAAAFAIYLVWAPA